MAPRSLGSYHDLWEVLRADVVHTSAVAAMVGATLHVLLLSRVEVEQFALTLLSFLSLVAAALGCSYYAVGYTAFDALVRTALASASFNTGLFASMAIYRAFLHPLSGFPGPFGARISSFYALTQAAKEAKYHEELERMHQQYGDFVRTGPRQLCVVRKSAPLLFFGHNSECRHSTWYLHKDVDNTKTSVHLVRDAKVHKTRRKACDKGFAIKAIRSYEPRVKAKVDLFVDRMRETQPPVDGTAWSMLLSFDIMGDVGLGKDFGGVSSGIEHPAIKGLHDHMGMLATLGRVPWLLNILSRIPGATAGYAPFFRFCAGEVRSKEANWNPEDTPQDIMSWLLQAAAERDVSAPPSRVALDEESRLIIVAGSETTATVLAAVFFYLAKYSRVQAKLREKIIDVLPTPAAWDYEKVKLISYIDDVINESLRLKPALLIGGSREVPCQGIWVDEVFIPGGTNVFVPMKMIQTDRRYWKDSEDFIPERFGERRTEMGTDDAPFIPFSLGAYACPGKNLAMLTMRTTISRVLQEFDMSLAPGENGERFDREATENFTTTLPSVMLKFTPRHGGHTQQ